MLRRLKCLRKHSTYKVKVKCTLVQVLRLCAGRTAHKESRGVGKSKVHPYTDTEALYWPYGP
jgi:Leu/Phe-tRNA-protein transferase